MVIRSLLIAFISVFLLSCVKSTNSTDQQLQADQPPKAGSGFFLKSSAFMNGTYIPVKYTCDGENISPDLFWGDFPPQTQSFVIIMEDPDAPFGLFVHWIVYDIPYYITSLKENLPKQPVVDGTIKQGINDFGKIGYFGPCPPRGFPHRYYFRIYALDIPLLGLPPGAVKEDVWNAMEGHILSQTHLVGLYGR
ncbi:MAG: YbhB/YbcL family Raf kinase inhibitor-like protein [Aquificae bacterium]|nr:YbhB/YbcL family Raf kinase inhibitor-like protein [Aquificota bacterium]